MSFGIIEFFVVSAESVKLSEKESYFLDCIFPQPAAKPYTSFRTAKCHPPQLQWQCSGDVVLVSTLRPKDCLDLILWEKGLFHDEIVGKGSVNLECLTHGNNISSVDFPVSKGGEPVAVVKLRVEWKTMPANLLEATEAQEMGHTAAAPSTGGAPGHVADQKHPQHAAKLPDCHGNTYSVRIRAHKGRNLQSFKEDKLYNPQIVVSMLDKTGRTEVCKKTNDPIWDEEITFAVKNAKETFWNEVITVTVMNHRFGLPNETIGSVQLDCATVYRAPQHFIQNKWMVLHRSATEGNVMGFVKLSIAVLNLRTDAFPEQEEEEEEESEDTIISNLMMGPGSVFEEILLHCDVLKAEGIPQMDSGVGGTADPYVRFIFGKRVVNTPHISNTLTPVWNTSVNLPLLLPSLANTIVVQMWDYDIGSPDDLIATNRININELVAMGSEGLPRLPLQWVTFYGHPRNSDADYNKYYKALAKAEKKGTDYRGRLLIGMNGVRGRPPTAVPSYQPVVVEVEIRAQLLSFLMLPNSGQFKVRVSMGTFYIMTQVRSTSEMLGISGQHHVYFGEEVLLKAKFEVVPPENDGDASVEDQLPDVMFQLVQDKMFSGFLSGSKEVDAYASTRFPAKKLKSTKKMFYKCKPMRLNTDPERVREGSAPPNPIAQLACQVRIADAKPVHPQIPREEWGLWKNMISTAAPEKFILECCVYGAKEIPAGDDNGLSDPFVRVTWANASSRTGTKKETLNPMYNELVRVVADVRPPFPDVVVEVWDWDLIGSNTFLCKTVIPFDNQLEAGERRWYSHFTDSFGKKVGCEMLMRFRLVKATPAMLTSEPPKTTFLHKVGSSSTYQGYTIPKELALPTAMYSIKVGLLGLRHMRKFRLRDIQRPSVDMEIAGRVFNFPPLAGPNPCYEKEFEVVMELPDDPQCLPPLSLRVYDHRLGPKTLIGAGRVPLGEDGCNPLSKHAKRQQTDKDVLDRLAKLQEEKERLLAPPAAPPAAAASKGLPRKSVRLARNPMEDNSQSEHTGLLEGSPNNLQEPLLDPTNEDAPPPADVFDDPEALPEGASDAISDTSSEAAEDLWFDRFDPLGTGYSVDPDKVVSRLGHSKVLPPGQATLEDYFGPFNDDYQELPLMRGWGSEAKRAGTALIDVSLVKVGVQEKETPGIPALRNIEHRQAGRFILRIYIIGCSNLAAMDDGPLGKASDPYIILALSSGGGGSKAVTLSCKDECKYQTLDPEYYFMREMEGELPTQNFLKITVMDYDKIGRDEEIGFTEINLEDRWYSRRGYSSGAPYLAPGSYTEKRVLCDEQGLSKGQIELWLDMFATGSSIPRPIDVAPPPPLNLELRVVVWAVRDCVLTDTSLAGEEMTDIYVRCWLDGMLHDVQNTDVHYRSLDGNGTFNWRMIFSVVFDPRTHKITPIGKKSKLLKFFSIRKEEKKLDPLLHVQIFDNDLLPGTDDYIGESNVRLLDVRTVCTHREKSTLLSLLTDDVTTCCGWLPSCCRGPKGKLSLGERQALAAKEIREEEVARRKMWESAADKKIEALRNKKIYSEDQLVLMRKKYIKEAKRESVINVFDPYLPHKKKKNAVVMETKENPPVVETPKFWVACRGPNGGLRVGDVQLSFQLARVEAIEEDTALAAGKGRSEPSALPDPNRPPSSFFWLSSPWKSAVQILWKNYKWYFFTVICIVIFALFAYVFVTEGIKVKTQSLFK